MRPRLWKVASTWSSENGPIKSGFTFYLKVYGTAIFSSVYISIFCERTVVFTRSCGLWTLQTVWKRFAVYFYIQVNKCMNYIQYILVNMLKGGFLLLCVGSLFWGFSQVQCCQNLLITAFVRKCRKWIHIELFGHIWLESQISLWIYRFFIF